MPDFTHETHFRKQGYRVIAGVDEAGRGPLAGPVVAGAVILPTDFQNAVLNDSKKLSQKKRNELFSLLECDENISCGVGIVDVAEIDQMNILRATHQAMNLALKDLTAVPDFALVDGLPVKGLSFLHQAIVKGDSISLSISAASIVAKVTRDRIMAEYAVEFPMYGFDRNQGYGTREHLAALREHGPCRIHRRSFQPVAQLSLPFS